MSVPENAFVRDYVAGKKLTVKSFDESRDWGGFYILETGPNYDVKILWVKPQELLSLQSHGTAERPGHHELWTALTNARAVRGRAPEALGIIDMMPGRIVTIAGGLLHSLANPFSQDDVYVSEVRISRGDETPQRREESITRIYDKYERHGTPPYPKELVKAILGTPFDPKWA